MKIGNIKFCEYPVFAAPMENISEPSFRYMCKKYGADLLFTEFASSNLVVRKANTTTRKLINFDYEHPIAIQLFGNDTQSMVEAAKIAATYNPDIIDINFGCPVLNIINKGSGSAMFRTLPLMKEITESVVKAVNIPITIKTRLGWDENNKPIVEVAEMLQDCGIEALTIHGRTREQMYTGKADWSLIADVKNNPRMKIPIIGNGDITSPEIAKQMFDNYGVDAIMIGRASIGNPWIFKEVKHYLDTGEILNHSIKEQLLDLKEFTIKSVEFKGLPSGIVHMRRQYAHTLRGLEGFGETRIKLLRATSLEDALAILDEIQEGWA